MRGMNRCDMAVVCTDVCNAWNVGAKCRCRQMWFWNVRNVGVAQPTAALQRGSHYITTHIHSHPQAHKRLYTPFCGNYAPMSHISPHLFPSTDIATKRS